MTPTLSLLLPSLLLCCCCCCCCSFRQWQEQQERESPAPPATLSGKVLLLARLRPPPPPPPTADDAKGKGDGEQPLVVTAVAEEDGGGKVDMEDGKANGFDGVEAAAAVAGPKGSSAAPSTAISSSWRACWVSGEAVRGGGIRISRHTVTDHWVSRLMALLTDLAAASATGAGEGGAPPAEAPAAALGADV